MRRQVDRGGEGSERGRHRGGRSAGVVPGGCASGPRGRGDEGHCGLGRLGRRAVLARSGSRSLRRGQRRARRPGARRPRHPRFGGRPAGQRRRRADRVGCAAWLERSASSRIMTGGAVSLTLDQVKERARRAPMVPIFRDVLSDALTPVTAFAALAGEGPAYLLESVERGEQLGRYSFVAADPLAIVTIAGGRATVQDANGRRELEGPDPLRALEAYLKTFAAEPAEGLPEGFCGGAVGYLGYEAARYLERLPTPDADPLQVADGVFVITDTLACFDPLRPRFKLVTHIRTQRPPIESRYAEAVARIDDLARRLNRTIRLRALEPADRPANVNPEGHISQPEFFKAVEKAKSHILAGDIYQVQIAQPFTTPLQAQAFHVYRLFRALEPTPDIGFLQLAATPLIATSPENPV